MRCPLRVRVGVRVRVRVRVRVSAIDCIAVAGPLSRGWG